METTSYFIQQPLITLSNISLKYGHKLILRDIGTEQRPFVINDIHRSGLGEGKYTGQTIAVVGASGSGKSSLFKLMSGLVKPTTGTIHIPRSDNFKEYKTVGEGDVGFVQQHYPLSRNQSILGMLNDAAKQGNIPTSERQNIIDNYLENWGLMHVRNQSKNQLSGGQKQRVAIIEQLLCSHYFIIFDEPFSGLDVRNIEDVKTSFQHISSSHDINTIIFSTHDIQLAVEMADHIFVIGHEKGEDGKLKPGGTVVREYDLKKTNLAWKQFSPEHLELSNEISEVIRKGG